MGIAPTLKTERLILRAHTAQDFEDCAALWADPDVIKHITANPSTRSESWSRLLRYAGHWALLGYGYWVVTDHENTFLGEVGFADFQRDLTPKIHTPEAGWVLATNAHGRSIATEAMSAAHQWLDPQHPETCALFDPEHAVSHNVATKLGYTKSHTADFLGRPTLVMTRTTVAI